MKTKLAIIILFFALKINAQKIGINTTTPTNSLSVKGTLDVSDSLAIGITKPLAKLDVNGTVLFRGKNSNSFNNTVSAGAEFFVGRDALGTMPAGLINADIAFNWGGVNGGFRHFISTRHNYLTNSYTNAIDFSLNNSSLNNGSISPNEGSKTMLTISARGIGIDNQAPNAPLKFKNEYLDKKLVLFDNNSNSIYDQNFYGFGVNQSSLRYQSMDSHTFYSKIDELSSKEVFKISNLGNVNMMGNMGIGTAGTPQEKLYVNGNAKIETDFIVGGNSTLDGDANITGNANVTNNLTVNGTIDIGLTYLVIDDSIPAYSIKSVFISCPTGKQLLSGGGGNRIFNSDTDEVILNYNGPDPNAPFTTWKITATNTSTNTLPLRINCLCARIK